MRIIPFFDTDHVEYAWSVIRETAEEVMELHAEELGGVQVSEVAHGGEGKGRRVSKEVTEIYKDLGKRRFTLARETSILNDITSRGSVDLCDEEVVPRSRSGSLFPASAFVDDFQQARSRSGSLLPQITQITLTDLQEDEAQTTTTK